VTRCRHTLTALLVLHSLGLAATAPQGIPRDDFTKSFALATPEQVGIDSDKLLVLTDWLKDHPVPIFSLLISRHGRLVYELYTSSLDREQAHYVMSVTKSFVSALVGIAIDDKLLPGPDAPIAKLLPRRLFASDQDFARFTDVTIRQVLGMAALDAPVPPHDQSAAAGQRQQAFWSAPNRVAFALTQALLPGKPPPFQYNDITPMLAVGLLQYASGKTAFEFAQQHLFAPMGFRNVEWMHQDATGIDHGGYGLRLRPIDMQKFGVLYLRRGNWDGRQLLSKSWVDLSFTPWNRSKPEYAQPNYGWFWWTRRDAKWPRHEANGWKGQRIAVIPAQGLVVTMTACFEDGSEDEVFGKIVDDLLPPAVRNSSGAALAPAPAAQTKLRELLQQARSWQRVAASLDPRMLPAVANKEARKPFADAETAHDRGR
jgi:CubicO group peptidase (beta-lactamase class C family)